MKKKYLVAAGSVVLLILAVCLIKFWTEREQLKGYSDEYVAMKELPGQMSFTYYEKPEWEEIIGGINGGRRLRGKLTYGKLEDLLKELSLEQYITYEGKMDFQTVPRKEWNQIYKQILDLLDVEQTVTVTDLVFIDGKIKDNQMLTQDGYYKVSEEIASYFGKYDIYEVYIKEREIIGVKSVSEKEVVWKNVFVHKAEKEKAQILYEKQKISIDVAGLKESITDTICDIAWKNNQVSAIYKKEDMIQGKVLSFNENQIEISGYGTLEYEGKMRIYKTYGTVEQLDESKLIIGNLQADFVVAEKKVCGIILKQPAEIKSIRVLLLNGEKPYWESTSFVSDVECTVSAGENQQIIPAGQVIVAESMIPEGSNDYVKITPNDELGKIYHSDVSGTRTMPGYQGSMEVRRYPEGLGIVNELLLEQYLYGVVPSEMPASYETEALRAQAVCARSYAYMQLMKGDYAAFAAHVDDSTNYQVYNKQEGDEKTRLAVDDTIGEVIKYNGEIAETYYFSTSCGHTDNMSIWNFDIGGKNGYLTGATLLTDGSEPDFSSEEAFAAFIKNKEITAFDSDAPYFRWQAELDTAGKQETVNQAVIERMEANPANIQMTKEDGVPAGAADITGFGAITGIQPVERSSGGCVKQMQISYEHGTIQVLTEYNIRYILGRTISRLTDKSDKEVTMTLLPSAYITIEPVELGYVVYGGGYGHGIGMSQNGANGMAKAGKNYIDILMQYYNGITIENIYNGE